MTVTLGGSVVAGKRYKSSEKVEYNEQKKLNRLSKANAGSIR